MLTSGYQAIKEKKKKHVLLFFRFSILRVSICIV